MTTGDRVTTPLGPGTVAYVRMDHLGDITKIFAVSVVLDHKAGRAGYVGTIFPAAEAKLT